MLFSRSDRVLLYPFYKLGTVEVYVLSVGFIMGNGCCARQFVELAFRDAQELACFLKCQYLFRSGGFSGVALDARQDFFYRSEAVQSALDLGEPFGLLCIAILFWHFFAFFDFRIKEASLRHQSD